MFTDIREVGHDGHASSQAIGFDSQRRRWRLKTPQKDRSLQVARELIGVRLAEMLRLPVPKTIGYGTPASPLTASLEICGLRPIESWEEAGFISPLLVVHATALRDFDRIRPERPRDVFLDATRKLWVLDFEGFDSPGLFRGNLPDQRTAPPDEAVVVAKRLDATGLSAATRRLGEVIADASGLDQVVDEVRRNIGDGSQWTELSGERLSKWLRANTPPWS